MSRNRGARAVLKFVMSLCLVFSLTISLTGTAQAASLIDVERDGTLTLDCRYDGDALENVNFQVYRVADMSKNARFTLSGDFKSYPVSLSALDAAGWKNAANTLATYAGADQLKPLAMGATDTSGKLSFGTMHTGLYLVVGEDRKVGRTTYRFAPFLICLPSLQQDGTWLYNVAINPKTSSDTESRPGGGGGTTDPTGKISVVKHWVDDGHEEARPEEITVALLKDDVVHDTVKLSEDNFWRHTWEGLSEKFEWSVVEKSVPEHYTVTYAGETTVFTVTNSYTEDIPEPDVPTTDVPNTPDTPDTPGTPDTPDTPDTPGTPGKTVDIPDEDVPLSLPQTGQLWWPVPLLAAAGLLLFSLGWFLTFRGGKREDEA